MREQTIQEQARDIIKKFGNTEMGQYKIQLMCDDFAVKYFEKNKHKAINEQVEILKEVLNEMMTGFDTEEDRIDFILDICNGYKKRIENN